MFNKIFLLCSLLCLGFSAWAQEEYQLRYVERYSGIAIREMERAGIPASIKLAQGILESNSGRSDLAKRANNHFGIKCGGNWSGRKVYKEDDDYDAEGRLIESCFRVYRDVEASYVAHSEFLRDPNKTDRYGFLFRLDPTDYRRWAIGLKRAGYATSATYHTKLISLIERLELYKFDEMTSTELVVDTDFTTGGFLTINDVEYVIAEEDETVNEIARRTDTTLRRLIKYNEELDDGDQRLAEGQKVYLQRKRNSFRGKKTWHYVHEGETMYDISQRYGVKLSKLYKRNRMDEGQEPAVNERIKVRGGKVDERPRLTTERPAPAPPMPELIFEEEEEPPTATDPTEDTLRTERPPFIDFGDFITPEEEKKMEEEILEEEMFEGEPAPTRPHREETRPDVIRPEPPQPPPRLPVRPEPAPEEEPAFDEELLPEIEPQQSARRERPAEPEPRDPATGNYHTVKSGDTLWNISQRYGTTVEKLVELNNLQNYNIRIGQRLRVR